MIQEPYVRARLGTGIVEYNISMRGTPLTWALLTVETLPVNQRPILSVIPFFTVLEANASAPPLRIPRVVFDLAAGPWVPDEANQSVSLTAVEYAPGGVVQSALFSPDGTLEIVLTPFRSATSFWYVEARDSGGVDNLGAKDTTKVNFTIGVTPVNRRPAFGVDCGDPGSRNATLTERDPILNPSTPMIDSGLVGSTSLGGVPREQKMLKGHLPRVISPSILVNEGKKRLTPTTIRG